jgi:hypothetical protein
MSLQSCCASDGRKRKAAIFGGRLVYPKGKRA